MTARIERTCELDAEPESVWRAITDPGRLCEWLADEVELELWPGGEARFLIDGQERLGWVEEVTPPAAERPGRLAFWWQVGAEPVSRVVLELVPGERGTRLWVAETRPLELLDLGSGGTHGPALVAA